VGNVEIAAEPFESQAAVKLDPLMLHTASHPSFDDLLEMAKELARLHQLACYRAKVETYQIY